MRQLTKRRVAAFIGGALYGLTAASPVLADDTEIYVGLANTATGSKPNVLFVIDTSGSMDTDVTITTSTAAYNPAVTYTGSTCVSTRLYWSATGSIPDCSTSQYFTASQYRCDTGSTAMGTTGFYQDRHARWSTFGTDRWRTFSSAWGKNPPHVDCKADNGTHGENSTDPKVYIKNQSGSNKDPWTATPSSGINWDSTGGFYTVYNHNYMNWANESTSTSTTTRLQIVKDVVNGIINANSGLKVGLMRFDTKSHGSSSRNKGGPVIHAITDIDTAGVKTALVNAVNGLTASSYTPLAETLYEALLYYRGQAVKFGKAPNNIVSVTPSLNPSDPNKYASPITNQCQKNFVVYLTDDAPTRDKDADTDITTLLSGASGLTLGSCGFNNSPSDDCLDEVAEYMKEQDHATTALGNEQAGTQNIITYTVGFATSQTLLSSAATLGGGKYYTANNSTELASAFTQIVAEIQAVNSTFTAPAVSVNAFNRIQHRKELYFTLFKPAAQPHWDGNVKRFELDFVLDASGNPLDDDGDGIPNPPEILDVNGDAAVDANTGFFKSTATSYWTPTADAPDGEQTEKGGAASKLPDPPSTRKVYTNISTTIFDLANAANKLHEDTTAITETVLGLSAGATDPSRAELLRWSRGVDINDDDEDSSTTDGRLVLGAPLHARPLLVTYGGTETNPDLTLYALTNDGYLHAIDPDDGTEVFSFVPKEHLDNLKTLYDDTGAVTTINYGVDGNFEVWVEDHNDNGIIETPDSGSNYDHVYVYFGMRRGRTTYYALDVTDRTALKVLWSITGGEGGTVTGTTGFDELADTWSDPQHHTIKVLSGGALVSKDVIVFGGGYDAGQDNATNPTTDDEGRAIYIVDATTGALLWWAGKTGVAPTPGPDLALSAMDYSIPSQVRVLDINTDGIADRMYVGDMGGQVWRYPRVGVDHLVHPAPVRGRRILETGGFDKC